MAATITIHFGIAAYSQDHRICGHVHRSRANACPWGVPEIGEAR